MDLPTSPDITNQQSPHMTTMPRAPLSHALYMNKKRTFLILSTILVVLAVIAMSLWSKKALAPKPLSQEEKIDILTDLQSKKPTDGSPYLTEVERENIMRDLAKQGIQKAPVVTKKK